MIIIGTRGVTFGGTAGTFDCPRCGPGRSYRHRTVRRFFTLYFIPIIPLDKLGEFIECSSCKAQFSTDVLNFDPEQANRRAEIEFCEHVKFLMILTSLIEGEPSAEQLDAVRQACTILSGSAPSPADLEREIARAQRETLDLPAYARQHFSGHLYDRGKENVIRAVLAVANADGDMTAREEAQILELAVAVGISPAHYRGIAAEISDSRHEAGVDPNEWDEVE